MDDLSLLDLSIEASAFGTQPQATSSSVSKVLMDTETVYTLSRFRQQVANWSVAAWTRLSRCGSWLRSEASFPRLRPMVGNASEHLKGTRLVILVLSSLVDVNYQLGLCAQRLLDARWRVGDERLEGSWRAVLGPEYWTRPDDASGTQELCHLGRTEPHRQLLRYWKRRQQSKDLELSEHQRLNVVSHRSLCQVKGAVL